MPALVLVAAAAAAASAARQPDSLQPAVQAASARGWNTFLATTQTNKEAGDLFLSTSPNVTRAQTAAETGYGNVRPAWVKPPASLLRT